MQDESTKQQSKPSNSNAIIARGRRVNTLRKRGGTKLDSGENGLTLGPIRRSARPCRNAERVGSD